MRIYVTGFLLIMLIGPALAGNNSADNWTLVPSADEFWIKTVSGDQHELLVAYHEYEAQFMLILKTHILKIEGLSADKTLPVSIKIDRGAMQAARLSFVEKGPEQSIVRIEADEDEQITRLGQMIVGQTMSIYFDFTAANNKRISKKISFSLKGFTVALNDLLIANEIGSLDPAWLLQHKKDSELFCLLTTNISIEAMQHRLKGESYSSVLQLIAKTGHSVIDHNLEEIIEQVYEIPQRNLANVPRAEKYLMFSNCMAQIL